MTRTHSKPAKLIAISIWIGLLYSQALAAPPAPALWQPVPELSDEFDGEQLDLAKWHPNNPKWKGKQPGYFSTNNVAVSDGTLQLTMKLETPPPEAPASYNTYTCAAVKSTERVLYGYFEVRAQAMDSGGSSSFWFYDDTPDLWTEIDVYEIAAKAPGFEKKVHMTTHVFRSPSTGTEHLHDSTTKIVDSDLAASYRVYGLEWTPTKISWYIDGEVARSTTNTYWHQPLYINFDTETMPKWFGLPDPAGLPSIYHIDYFRAWKQTP